LEAAATGFVPSLEVLPFIAWAPAESIRLRAFPGYGDVARGLLTGELEAGLLPWELLVTDLLLKPGQRGEWRVPAVLRACPMELVLGQSAIKRVYPSRRRPVAAGSVKLVFGIEARNSFTRLQILDWQQGKDLPHLAPPSFKSLPMNLMLRGLEAGVVDGVLAPAPWGMQAERDGCGKIDPAFDAGAFAQHLVLVCRRRMEDRQHELLAGLPAGLRRLGGLMARQSDLDQAARRMVELGTPRLDPGLLWEAAQRYPTRADSGEFIPGLEWFVEELAVLARRHAMESTPGPLTELARSLVFQY
jgi:ABC-type nitrate/sulfonate/bicarbonate transport system substrate-binding protein